MTPYQYVHNNPIMFTDPTGMSAEGADGGGWLSKAWNSSKNEVKSWFGGRKSNYEVIVEEPQLIGWYYGESIPCVECHHTTTGSNTKADPINRYPKDIIEVKEGVALWGMASDSGLTTEHKRTSILFSLGMEDVFMRSSAGGTGSKWTYEFLSGMDSREDDFKNGGGLFKSDKVTKHSFKGYFVGRPGFSDRPFSAMPTTRDTILRESQINNTDWNRVSTIDSLRKAQSAKRLNESNNL